MNIEDTKGARPGSGAGYQRPANEAVGGRSAYQGEILQGDLGRGNVPTIDLADLGRGDVPTVDLGAAACPDQVPYNPSPAVEQSVAAVGNKTRETQ